MQLAPAAELSTRPILYSQQVLNDRLLLHFNCDDNVDTDYCCFSTIHLIITQRLGPLTVLLYNGRRRSLSGESEKKGELVDRKRLCVCVCYTTKLVVPSCAVSDGEACVIQENCC